MEINCHEAFVRRSRPVVELEKKCDFSKKGFYHKVVDEAKPCSHFIYG